MLLTGQLLFAHYKGFFLPQCLHMQPELKEFKGLSECKQKMKAKTVQLFIHVRGLYKERCIFQIFS